MSKPLGRTINIIIAYCRVSRNPIIPQTDGAVVPLDADLKILTE
jgi:hypothetical protein